MFPKEKITHLKPEYYLCPYCKQWHSYTLVKGFEVPSTKGYINPTKWYCQDQIYQFFIGNGCFYYSDGESCNGVPISEFIVSKDKPIITVDVKWDSEECRTLGFRFRDDEFERVISEVEFNLNKDENLRSTFYGVAVNTNEGWRGYSKDKNKIINIEEMELGKSPIFIIPTTKLKKGDLIINRLEYYFVQNIEQNGTYQAENVKTNEVETIKPLKMVMGFEIYAKVERLTMDFFGAETEATIEKMALMSAMHKDEIANILPFLMIKDNDKMFMVYEAMKREKGTGDETYMFNKSMQHGVISNQMQMQRYMQMKKMMDDELCNIEMTKEKNPKSGEE